MFVTFTIVFRLLIRLFDFEETNSNKVCESVDELRVVKVEWEILVTIQMIAVMGTIII